MKEFNYYRTFIDSKDGSVTLMMGELSNLSKEGWEIVHVHTEVIDGDIHYYYLLQRDVNPGLKTLNEKMLSL